MLSVALRLFIFCLFHPCIQGPQVPVNTEVLAQMIQYFDEKLQPGGNNQYSVLIRVFAVPQRILLLCLLHFCTCAAAETVDPKTLMSIVKNFEKQLGNMGQYAVAFRVEKHRCLKGSDYPSKELLTKVKEKLQSNEVYVSDDLIAAKRNGNEHSEFRLKNHLKNILKDEDECVGFFTKFTVFLSGFLLLFLLPDWTESVDTVDINTLTHIINFFEQNYKRVDEDGYPRQYAVAINVPKHQCQQNFSPAQNNFLTQEDALNVRNAITDDINALYQGVELIAAGTRKVAIRRHTYNMHSESLLLNPADNSPMTNLLNKRKDGCSVFYTFDSPCVESCLNVTRNHNIIEALRKWKEHDGIKAFVFMNIWKNDLGKDLQNEFKKIAAHVPLYRCVSETECYACNGERNTPIDARCLPPPVIATTVMQ
ncbi:hypothetical protein G5714_015397 [Onychostoma macrolepis]|uniref:Uncharacterized protein n=1 Tax=Onychostoma macrolepis TaxID=369639 RepID=A0A7J6CB34_9TELE|nr:hypothetical protein G5714_015397 [Onychostoma macrolepis]